MLQSLMVMGTRNLRRNPRRTLTTSLSVAFGVCIVTVLIGSRQDVHDRIINSAIRSGPGMFSVAQPGFLSEPSPSLRARFSEDMIARLAQLPKVKAVAPRIGVMAVAYTPKTSTGAEMLGLDIKREDRTTNSMLGSLVAGEGMTAGESDGSLIGDVMAEHLGLKVGNKMVFSTTDAHGEIVSNLVHIRGLFHTGSPELDGHFVIAPLTLLQNTLNYDKEEASFLALFAPPDTPLSATKEAIKAKLANTSLTNLEVSSWRESLPDVAQVLAIDTSFQSLVVGMATLIIGTGILNAMMFNVFERRREFGIMLATGLSPSGLVLMVAWEGFMLGLVGLAIGSALAAPIYFYLHDIGINLEPFIGDKQHAEVVDPNLLLGCRLTLSQMAMIASTLLATSVVAGLYPACRAAWTVPIKAIRAG